MITSNFIRVPSKNTTPSFSTFLISGLEILIRKRERVSEGVKERVHERACEKMTHAPPHHTPQHTMHTRTRTYTHKHAHTQHDTHPHRERARAREGESGRERESERDRERKREERREKESRYTISGSELSGGFVAEAVSFLPPPQCNLLAICATNPRVTGCFSDRRW